MLFRSVVILDPELTVGLPRHVTAATGLDAFVHCFEAYCAPGFHPLAEGIALEGMRLVAQYLPRACADGTDIEARAHMLAAASMGAAAFQKGLGGVHAIAHPVGSWFNTHHGLANAVLLPYVMCHNRYAIEAHCARIARVIGLTDLSFDGLLAWVLALRRQLGIPHSLAEVGVDDRNATVIGQEAAVDPSAGGNPIPIDAAGYEALFRAAIAGRLPAAA